jgi:hypothetical protein
LAFTFAFKLATKRLGELEQERRRRAPFGHAETAHLGSAG